MVCLNLGGDRSGWLDTLPKHDLSIHWMGRMDHSHAAQRSGAERATDRVTLWHIRNVYQCIRELFLGTIPDNGNFLYGTYFYNGRTLSRSRNTRKKIN